MTLVFCSVHHHKGEPASYHQVFVSLIQFFVIFQQVQEVKGTLDMHIHFWLGKESSQVCDMSTV